jgi:oxidoreductase
MIDFAALYEGNRAEQDKFDSLSHSFDSIYIAMGTTRAAAGSTQAFEKIDRGYVLTAAKALSKQGSGATLVYCSSRSSSSSSWVPYLKSKGLTEEGLAGLYSNTVIMRPGFLKNAGRPESRIFELFLEPLLGAVSALTDSWQASVSDVAKAMVAAAQKGPETLKAQRTGEVPGNSFRLQSGASRKGLAIVQNPGVLALARDQPAKA